MAHLKKPIDAFRTLANKPKKWRILSWFYRTCWRNKYGSTPSRSPLHCTSPCSPSTIAFL